MKKKTFRLNKETVARLDDLDSVTGGCGVSMICPTLFGCTFTVCPTVIGCTITVCRRFGDEAVGVARDCPVDGGPVEIGPVGGN